MTSENQDDDHRTGSGNNFQMKRDSDAIPMPTPTFFVHARLADDIVRLVRCCLTTKINDVNKTTPLGPHTAFPEQRIPGLRPAFLEQRRRLRRPERPKGHAAFGGLKTAFGGQKIAFGRYSLSNAFLTYALLTPSDAPPPYTVVASTVPSLLI